MDGLLEVPDDGLELGDPLSVGDPEPLPDDVGLADVAVDFGDVVGFAVLLGSGLTVGLGNDDGGSTVLGLGDDVVLSLVLGAAAEADELMCCTVLGPVTWLPWWMRCPLRYRPARAARAHSTAVRPASASRRPPGAPGSRGRPGRSRRLGQARLDVIAGHQAGRGGRQVGSGRAGLACPGHAGQIGPRDPVGAPPKASASRSISARSATTRTLAGRPAGVLASMS